MARGDRGQPSAYPYHDWNERIAAECYAPNATARILDGENRIVAIVNNYASMSFNFGPTLLSWLEEKEPEVYRAILEADDESRSRFAGPRLGAGAGLQPHDPAARERARPAHAGRSGASRDFVAPLRAPRPRGCGCRRRPSTSRRSRPWPPSGIALHDPRRRTRRATSAKLGEEELGGRRAGGAIDPTHAYRVTRPVRAARSRSSSTTGRSRARSPSSGCCRRASGSPSVWSGRSRTARAAAARPRRDRRRDLRPPPPPRRHGARLRAPHARESQRRAA